VTAIDRALFIAAGSGLRLGQRGIELPKGLLRIGDTTLMERAIELLRGAGVTDITIVTGHLREQYDALAARLGHGVRTVFNADFASHGASRSLAVGLEVVQGPMLMLESDIVWEKRALDAMLEGGRLAGPLGGARRWESSLLTSGLTSAGDEVWVWAGGTAERPTLEAMSKSPSFRPHPPFGELVGMIRIDEALRKRLLDVIRLAEADQPYVAYETCLTVAAAETPVALVHIDDLVWGEIDDESMYARIRDKVWPLIAAAAASENQRSLDAV
jgi:choline kinase